MTEPRILCVGALTCDLMLQVPSLPVASGKYLANRAVMVVAGMAASAATAAARLGQPTALWASVGDDMLGDFLLAEIAREGIETREIRRVSQAMSATASILLDATGERIVVPYYDPALLDAPGHVPPIEGGSMRAVLVDVRWPAAASIALATARKAGIPAILDLDVGPRETLASLLPLATHVVASLAGAGIMTGAVEAGEAVAALSRHTDAVIAVTAGEHGLAYREAGSADVLRLPAFTVDAVDTNAAGDVFHGAFAVALAEGMPLAACLRFAAAAAAIKCTRYGGRTGAPTRTEVDAFLQDRR